MGSFKKILKSVTVPLIIGGLVSGGSYLLLDNKLKEAYNSNVQATYEQFETEVMTNINSYESAILSYFNESEGLVKGFTRILGSLYDRDNYDLFYTLENSMYKSSSALKNLYFVDKDLGIKVKSNSILTQEDGYDVKSESWYTDVSEKGIAYSPIYESSNGKDLLVDFAKEGNGVIGVGEISLGQLIVSIDSRLHYSDFCALLSEDGKFDYTSNPKASVGSDLSVLSDIVADKFSEYVSLQGKHPSAVRYEEDGTDYLVLLDRIGSTSVYILDRLNLDNTVEYVDKGNPNPFLYSLAGLFSFVSLFGIGLYNSFRKSDKEKQKAMKDHMEVTSFVSNQLSVYLEEFTKGNYNYRIDIENAPEKIHNEIFSQYKSDLSELNAFADTFEKSYTELQETISNLAMSEEDKAQLESLKNSAQESLQKMQSQEKVNFDLLNNVQEKNQTLQTVYEKISNMVESTNAATNELSATSEELSATFVNTYNQIESAGKDVQQASVFFSDLSDGLENVIGLNMNIENLSEQLNVLAINGSIQAAHAGKSGAGFKVVVEEVGKLTSKTQEYANNTKYAIENLTSQVPVLKNAIDTILDRFTHLQQTTEEQKLATEELVRGTLNISEQTTSLDNFVKENKTYGDVTLFDTEQNKIES